MLSKDIYFHISKDEDTLVSFVPIRFWNSYKCAYDQDIFSEMMDVPEFLGDFDMYRAISEYSVVETRSLLLEMGFRTCKEFSHYMSDDSEDFEDSESSDEEDDYSDEEDYDPSDEERSDSSDDLNEDLEGFDDFVEFDEDSSENDCYD